MRSIRKRKVNKHFIRQVLNAGKPRLRFVRPAVNSDDMAHFFIFVSAEAPSQAYDRLELFKYCDFQESAMFASRVRRFAGTALRCAEAAAQMEASHAHGIEIAKAQRIAKNGFIDGTTSSAQWSLALS